MVTMLPRAAAIIVWVATGAPILHVGTALGIGHPTCAAGHRFLSIYGLVFRVRRGSWASRDS